MIHHLYGFDDADWLQLTAALAAWILVLAAYGLSVAAVEAQSRRAR